MACTLLCFVVECVIPNVCDTTPTTPSTASLTGMIFASIISEFTRLYYWYAQYISIITVHLKCIFCGLIYGCFLPIVFGITSTYGTHSILNDTQDLMLSAVLWHIVYAVHSKSHKTCTRFCFVLFCRVLDISTVHNVICDGFAISRRVTSVIERTSR